MAKTSGRRETTLTRRQFLKAVGAFGVATVGSGGLLTACGGGGQGGSSEPVGLSVSHWPTLLYTVPWAVAIEQGYFEERGISLDEIVRSSGGGETVRNVVTGGLPLGAVATPAAGVTEFDDRNPPCRLYEGAGWSVARSRPRYVATARSA